MLSNFINTATQEPEKVFANEYRRNSSDTFIEKSIKYKELLQFASVLENQLGQSNFDKSLGIFIDNRLEFTSAFLGAILNGYTVVAMCTQMNKAEIKKIIYDNNIEIILTVKDFSIQFDNIEIELFFLDDAIYPNLSSYSKFQHVKFNEEDIAVVSYTSGTSATFSKGVRLSFKNISFVSHEYKRLYSMDISSSIITVLPLWHNYAMFACLTSSIVAGAKLIIMQEWNYVDFIDICMRYKPDIFPGSPYMYIDIIDKSNNFVDLSSLRVCDSGGDSLPLECIKKFEEKTNVVITEGYGLTETTSLTHFNMSARERLPGTLGKPISEVECKIKDLDNNELPTNQWGVLWIRGPMVFKGYVNNDTLTNMVLVNGWLNTGDVVKVDNNGFYHIAGRLSDIQSLSAYEHNVREIESILYKFDGVKRVHVQKANKTDTDFEAYNIFLEVKQNINKSEVYDFIGINLKNIALNRIEFLETIPTTSTGKIKRNQLSGEV